ncbi:MAG: hypothetical protein WAY88_04350, partial [Minisyncoccia bacterium]
SQDHAQVDGDLYIYGEYIHSTGSDYWSYATDFDGTSLGGSSRQVDVRVASSSNIIMTGGVLDILGDASATTTIRVQGSGAYAFDVTGGTLNASYYELRNLDTDGLNLSGTPTITSLSSGDHELAVTGGSLIKVTASVIDANPLKIFTRNIFATSTAAPTGVNVTASGTSGSSWKFNLHYGGFAGEAYDSDPGGDPGYIRWDDSNGAITIAGNVYSDEGTTVSGVCDGSTLAVRLLIQGGSATSTPCNASTGAYSFSNITFNPGDATLVYLDGVAGRAAHVSVDPNTNIANMHLYHNRVIVRHEDTSPITIADMAIYDSSDDADIPFTAVDAGTDTLTIPAEKKLIVWNSKTFAPAGNVTVESGGSGNAWDGTLELFPSAVFSAAGTQAHSVGGSFIASTSASLSAASSTFTFTATTTGKTITSGNSAFYNITFNGTGGNWAFSGGTATTSNDFTIPAGTVTLPSATTTIGGSFNNTGGTFMHNNGTLYFTSTATGKTVRANNSDFYTLTFNGAGGAWTFADTNATSSQNLLVSAGTMTAPSGTLAIGGSFINAGTFTHNSGAIRFT